MNQLQLKTIIYSVLTTLAVLFALDNLFIMFLAVYIMVGLRVRHHEKEYFPDFSRASNIIIILFWFLVFFGGESPTKRALLGDIKILLKKLTNNKTVKFRSPIVLVKEDENKTQE